MASVKTVLTSPPKPQATWLFVLPQMFNKGLPNIEIKLVSTFPEYQLSKKHLKIIIIKKKRLFALLKYSTFSRNTRLCLWGMIWLAIAILGGNNIIVPSITSKFYFDHPCVIIIITFLFNCACSYKTWWVWENSSECTNTWSLVSC